MRFVRAYTLDGVLVAVMEQEMPFEPHQGIEASEGDLERNDLGLAEDFEPTDSATGAVCAPARHLYSRMERAPGGEFRARPGRELPPILDCPCEVEAIKQRLRERGPTGIPERAAHWLEFMGVFTPDDMEAAALPRLTVTGALEFDALRKARDPSVGSRADHFKAEARERIAERAQMRAEGPPRDAKVERDGVSQPATENRPEGADGRAIGPAEAQ